MHAKSHISFLSKKPLAALAFGVCMAPVLAFAFDPNQGEEPPVPAAKPSLPSPSLITGDTPRIHFPEVTGVVPPAPQEPAQLAETQGEMPALPPVDAAVAAQADQALQSEQAAQGFIAPAPLLTTEQHSQPEAQPNYSELPAPAAVAMEPEKLSTASKQILSAVPSQIDSTPVKKESKLNLSRTSPEVKPLSKPASKIETYDAVGLSIKVERPGLDTNFELNRAYTALMGGDTQEAINTYKNILSAEPTNEDALFGLASIYHRAGDLEKARPYYGELLKLNPNHREGLNNFMSLISDEAPQEALAELERLELRNPEFSPIPAQQALLLRKLGFADQAREKMFRAIELAPENLTYKYNLAVMLDGQGDYINAAALYRLLIDASLKGEKIPAPIETLQKRLNFIASVQIPTVATGS